MDRPDVTGVASAASNDTVVSAVVQPFSSGFDEDSILVERFLRGDLSAFETLYARYYEKVFAMARNILLDQEEAADAVQEIFTQVYKNLARFDRRSRFSTWLFRIAVNRSIQQARRTKYKSRQVELSEAYDREAAFETIESSDPKIYEALGEMPTQERALLVLFYWNDMPLQEIADSLGCNVNAAKTRLYRARERFRKLYEEY